MTYIGLPVVAKESDAYLLYDVDAKEILEYAPGIYWPLRKSKALRERGTGNKVVYLGFPLSSSLPNHQETQDGTQGGDGCLV